MKTRLLTLLLTGILALPCGAAFAQEYTQTPVTVSKDKVRGRDGKVYLSHVVKERQTLFSIAKAYGVSVNDIYDANPEKDLRTEGLKLNDIILIPATGSAQGQTPLAEGKDVVSSDEKNDIPPYIIHVVRWYENIGDIARKYDTSPEVIMKVNGLSSKKLKARMELKIPRSAADADAMLSEERPSAPDTAAAVAPAPADTASKEPLDDFLSIFTRKKEVKASLVLPLAASSGNPSDNYMDFYAGFLLAVRDLAEEGITTDLSVYDMSGGVLPLSTDRLRESDFVVGPVSVPDLRKVLEINAPGTPIISPLDPRAVALVRDHTSFIHAPSPYDAQYEELVSWIKEDLQPGDKVILISEKGAKNTEITTLTDSLMRASGIPHSSFSYSILEGRNVLGSLLPLVGSGCNRVIITSDSEAFVHDVVRNLGLLLYRKQAVVLYSAARIRSFGTIEVENLHNLSMHAALSYHIDYDDPRVRRFLMAFRALYNTEPSQFAFQGYDIASFFIRSVYEFGNRWTRSLASRDAERLLQSDFKFAEEGDHGGLVNQGVRRVIYQSDYTLRLLK